MTLREAYDQRIVAYVVDSAAPMTPRELYDQLVAYVVDMTPSKAYGQIVVYVVDNDNTSNEESFPDIPKEQAAQDWVGKSTRAGVQASLDAQQFLQHVEAIRALFQSSTIQDVWMKRAQANLNDSHNKYLSDSPESHPLHTSPHRGRYITSPCANDTNLS